MAAIVVKKMQKDKEAAGKPGADIVDCPSNGQDDTTAVPDETWAPLRMFLFHIVSSHQFEVLCAVVILFNMLLVILETDQSADDGDPDGWIGIIAYCLLGFYTVELTTKMYILRKKFFFDPWNDLDFCIVGVDLVLLVVGLIVANMPSVAILRVFRLVRLARAFKAAKQFRELNALIRSFGFAMKAIFWGILMIIMILTIWSILAVQLIHPINVKIAESGLYDGCDRCPRAFSSVFESCLTFWQQVVAGDSWGEVSLPIIHEAPWTGMFFLMVLVTVNLTMLNLILAVIVEAGARANEEDQHDKAVQAQKKIKQAELRLIELCSMLDTDQSGSLNIEEFLHGFEHNQEFAECLQMMSVTKSDINMIFNICDEDGSGDVNYVEFVDQLRRIRRQGEQMLLYYVTEIRHKVQQMKLRLVDHVTTVFEELPDACKQEAPSTAAISLEPEYAAEIIAEDIEEHAQEMRLQAQTRADHAVLGSQAAPAAARVNGGSGKERESEPKDVPMWQQPAMLLEPKPKAFESPGDESSGLRPGLLVEPRPPSPPTFGSDFFEEIGVLGTWSAMPSSQAAASTQSKMSRSIGGPAMQRTPGIAGIGAEQLERLLQINQDIVVVMQEVVLESKLHTGILNGLNIPPQSVLNDFGKSQLLMPHRCCAPGSRENTVRIV